MRILDLSSRRPKMGAQLGVGARSTPTPASPISAIDVSGWQGTMVVPADLAFSPIAVQRAGFTNTGTATTYSDTLYTTKRVRQVFPNQASLTASAVALSDYVFSTDTIAGVTNNSAETMPKPIVNWAMLGRQLVGNSLTLEVTGNHWSARNGKPFACVIFTVTDGTLTVSATATAMQISGHTGDKNAVLVYAATIDISTLATGLITANAKAYPWIGGAGSIADSSLSSVAREFSPRSFYKDTTRFASPPLVYVASTGNDSTGVVSTNAATASATPCLTIQGAIDKLISTSGVTGGYVDGCRIRIKDTVNFGTSAAVAKAQRCAAVIVERDPNVTKATALLTQSAAWRGRLGVGTLLGGLTEGAIVFRDMTIQRTANVAMWQGEAANQLQVMIADDVSYDLGGFTASPLNNSHVYFDGVTCVNATGSSALAPGTYEIRMVRGMSVDRNFADIEGWLVLGSAILRPNVLSYGTRTSSGSIIQFNSLLNPSTANAVVNPGTATVGMSVSQNLVEVTHTTTSTPALRASSDSGTNNLTHVLFDNNTVASGHYQVGRMNMFYDETVGTYRTHKFCRISRTVAGGFYIKSDVFVGANGNGTPNPTDAPFHTGNWSELYGTNQRALMTLFVNTGSNNVGGDQGPAYAGISSVIASSQTVPQYSLSAGVTFTNWQATTTNSGTGAAVAGTGSGDYTLPTGSALIGVLTSTDEIFPFDLAGNSRDRGSVGCYR